ncbi:MAG: 50S ribosomal protein L4 [Candidatus Nomurabacteria bacterium]|nr:50S ribosomal protein L4 [Candidatus Nomurabacteria bacterium]USN87461.1 MAG: 50S ribosomal protein L4 [Candidatus Nomurabacteria bacterium]
MDAKIYSTEGKETGKITLPESVFGVKWNADLVHEVVVGMQANARESAAHTKDRSEVSGGGKKPWKQKGTGRARHGSRRSPIWTGGGVTHGPRNEKDYSVKINKKVRAKALATVLSRKLSDAEVIFVDSLNFAEPKTKDGKQVIKALATGTNQASLATKRKNTALVVLPTRNEAVELSFRNFGNIEVAQAKDINPVDLLTYKYVVIAEPASSVEVFSKRVGGSAVATK